jgi:hypothetical protein
LKDTGEVWREKVDFEICKGKALHSFGMTTKVIKKKEYISLFASELAVKLLKPQCKDDRSHPRGFAEVIIVPPV